MPKKRNNKNKRDARGYQTGPVVRPPPPPQPTHKTRSIPVLLDQLRSRLQLTTPLPAIFHDTPRFRTRFQRTVDRLLAYGFTWDQVGEAVAAVPVVSAADAYDTALLDWLCWHLTELPSVFTDGSLLSEAVEASSSSTTLAVIAATPRRKEERDTAVPIEVPPSPAGDAVANQLSAAAKVEQENEEALRLAQQKAWLVSQYALVDEGEDETTPVAAGSSVPDDVAEETSTGVVDEERKNELEVTAIDADQVKTSPEDVTLASLQVEHDTLQADLSNEANNYMRSKQDIKSLRQQLKQLKQRIQKQKGLVAKAAAKQRLAEHSPPPTPRVALDELDEEVVDEDCGVFDLFGDSAPDSAAKVDDVQESSNPSMTIVVPPDHIPLSWTGATPRRVLEDWCRKEKIRPPQFMGRGRSVKVLTQPTPIIIQHGGPNEHVVAAKALYQAVPQLPLYRLFPPFYRDLWLSWVGGDQQEAKAEEDARLAEYNGKIGWLMEKIPRGGDATEILQRNKGTKTTPSSSNSAALVEPSTEEVAWDDTATNSENKRNSPVDVHPSPEGRRLRELLLKKQEQSALYKDMFKIRQQLPIYKHRAEILASIQNNPVTIICAETGSGKTTQCSSYILEEAFAQHIGDTTSVLCTQPRRVAAVSVAERVAEELGEAAIGHLVGYSIRGETRRSASTRLLFCTTGVILRRLMDDPALRGISHVVVDEVHERQWQIDILLVILRSLVTTTRPDLKIVLMSATLDPSLFSKFFANAPVLHISGRTFPVQTFFLEDLLEQTQHVIEEGSQCALREGSNHRETVSLWVTRQGGEKRRETSDYVRNEDVSGHFTGYSLPTQRSLDLVDETVINYDLIEDVLVALEKPKSFGNAVEANSFCGAVLVFMPGIAEIRTLVDRLSAGRNFGDRRRYDIIPLHSTLSSNDQRRAFRPSPKGCKKIIVATNIAETSVTIPDVVFVIDSGRVREIQRDRRTSSRKLVATWCSRASAKQRAGRAGRVQAGVCLKLYSSRTESQIMRASTEPELRRMPLEEVCLSILAFDFTKNCSEFLTQTPQPPTPDAIEAAFTVLLEIGAVVRDESADSLTALGKHLAKLPVDARVGKMLIYGTVFRCIDPILTIAASLSTTKDPFLASQQGDGQALAMHSSMYDTSSDFVSFVNLWGDFRKSRESKDARKFARDKFVNFATLMEIQDNRSHFAELLYNLGFLGIPEWPRRKEEIEQALVQCAQNQNANLAGLVDAVVCGGLFPNVGRVMPKATKETAILHKNERLTVQRSVNSKLVDQRADRWLAFSEKFATQRRVSVSKTALVTPLSLMLFGSKLEVLHTQRRVRVDGWIELDSAAKTGLLFREIRLCLDALLRDLVDRPSRPLDDQTSGLLDDITQLLSTSSIA